MTDTKGRNYNDPVLETFVGPQILARQVTDEPVPINYLPARGAAVPYTGSPGFTASREMPESMRPHNPVANIATRMKQTAPVVAPVKQPVRTATIMERPAPATPSGGPATNAVSVEGMTMNEARRRGLIAGHVTPAPEGVADDDSRDVAKTAPTIGIARDGGRRTTPNMAPVAQPIASAPQPPANSIGATLAEAAQIDPESEDPLAEALRSGATDGEREVQRAPIAPSPLQPPPLRVKPVVVPPFKAPSLNDLPEPKLDAPVVVPAVSVVNPKETKRFVCSVDGKAFDYRWQLLKHIQKKFPGKEDELLAAYPASRQALARTAGTVSLGDNA